MATFRAKNLQVDISDEDKKALKVKAVLEGKTLSDLVRDMIHGYVQSNTGSKK